MSIQSIGRPCRGIVLTILLSLLPFGWVLAQVFVDVATDLGITHSYQSSLSGGGVSFCDFDQDGLDDLTLATADNAYIQFYRNTGSGFEQMPYAVFIDNTEEAKQLLWVDYDNDGDKDLYIATYGGSSNRLFRNDGLPVFTDVTAEAGLPTSTNRTFGACFGDFDRDGWLDLYYGIRVPFMPGENRHFLFRNNADGTFSEVTESSNTVAQATLPFCSAFFDYDNDRWPDIYTANDRYPVPNTMLRNNGDGTFTDTGVESGAGIALDAMCVTAADFNSDGWLDIYVTNTADGSALLMNQGSNGQLPVTYADSAQTAGVTFEDGIGWGSTALDGDNDGDLDLYVSGALAGSDVPSAAYYRNAGNGTFDEPEAGFVGDTVVSYNNATGDFNNDGYADIIVLNQAPFHCQLWENSGGDNNWLKIKLVGVLSNRDAIGARLDIYWQGQYQMRYTQCGTGFLGQNSDTQLLGLGPSSMVDSLVVTWPTGHEDRLFELAVNQMLTIIEGSTTEGEILVDPDVELTALVNSNTLQSTPPASLLYPNPASGVLSIKSTAEYFTIYKASGQPLRHGRVSSSPLTIDVRRLPPGHYYLLFWDSQGQRELLPWIKAQE